VSAAEDYRMGLLQERRDAERQDAARDLDQEEAELVEDAWAAAEWAAGVDERAADFDADFAEAMDRADGAWADRGWRE